MPSTTIQSSMLNFNETEDNQIHSNSSIVDIHDESPKPNFHRHSSTKPIQNSASNPLPSPPSPAPRELSQETSHDLHPSLSPVPSVNDTNNKTSMRTIKTTESTTLPPFQNKLEEHKAKLNHESLAQLLSPKSFSLDKSELDVASLTSNSPNTSLPSFNDALPMSVDIQPPTSSFSLNAQASFLQRQYNPIDSSIHPQNYSFQKPNASPLTPPREPNVTLMGKKTFMSSSSNMTKSLVHRHKDTSVKLNRKSRKSAYPRRAVQLPKAGLTMDDKLSKGIVKLDVFSIYLSNPSTLIYTPNPDAKVSRLSFPFYDHLGETPKMKSANIHDDNAGSRSFDNHTNDHLDNSDDSLEGGKGTKHSSTKNINTPPPPAPPQKGASTPSKSSSSRKSQSRKRKLSSTVNFSHIAKELMKQEDSAGEGTPKCLFRGQKVLPEEIEETKEIDLSRFKQTKGAPTVQWKGSPLDVPKNSEGYNELTKEEIQTCRILRILPAQYLHIKQVMLQQILKSHFKKRDAQAWFRIDVNKTNRLYDWFSALGWIPLREEWEERIPQIFGL